VHEVCACSHSAECSNTQTHQQHKMCQQDGLCQLHCPNVPSTAAAAAAAAVSSTTAAATAVTGGTMTAGPTTGGTVAGSMTRGGTGGSTTHGGTGSSTTTGGAGTSLAAAAAARGITAAEAGVGAGTRVMCSGTGPVRQQRQLMRVRSTATRVGRLMWVPLEAASAAQMRCSGWVVAAATRAAACGVLTATR
jgi:hypothetical protein